MGTSPGFHIVFAVLGVGLPLLMCVAEGLALWRRDEAWMLLARRWSKAFGILFAIGAVSGTVLSFELGLPFGRLVLVLWARALGHGPPDLTIKATAASEATLTAILVVTTVGGLILIPSLWLLFRVFKARNPQARA